MRTAFLMENELKYIKFYWISRISHKEIDKFDSLQRKIKYLNPILFHFTFVKKNCLKFAIMRRNG